MLLQVIRLKRSKREQNKERRGVFPSVKVSQWLSLSGAVTPIKDE